VAASAAQLCNLALIRVGVKAFIDDLDNGTSAEAIVCRVIYEAQRDLLLSKLAWPFATKHDVLAVVSGAERSGWAYVYALPTQCLKPLGIWSGDRNAPIDGQIPWTLEVADALDVKWLLTDQEDAELVYVATVENPTLFSPAFSDALRLGIAKELAMGLANKPELSHAILGEYELAVMRAKGEALSERQPDVEPEGEFIRARY
jgi:hypothetical protein